MALYDARRRNWQYDVRKHSSHMKCKDIRELLQKLNTVELKWLEHRRIVYHGLFELVFELLTNFSDSSRKQILREIFLFYEIVCCVYSLESPHQGDSNDIRNIPLFC